MSRQYERFDKIYLEPDPVYGNELASKFINYIMQGGKKATAQDVFYRAIDIFEEEIDIENPPGGGSSDHDSGEDVEEESEEEETEQGPPEDEDFSDQRTVMDAFEDAVGNVKPRIEVRSRRVGGATYQVPMEVPPRRKVSLAIRWIMEAADDYRNKRGVPLHEAIANELIDAYNQEGSAISTRHRVHRMAEANKAFAHLAW